MALLQRLLGILIAIPLLIGAFVFASFILALAAALALVIGVWLWWNTRKLRQAMARHAQDDGREGAGKVIEGEYRIEHDTRRPDRRER